MTLIQSLHTILPKRLARALLHLGRRSDGPARRLAVELAAEHIARTGEILVRSDEPDALTVLVFNAYRFPEDMEVLKARGGMTLVEIDMNVLQEINGLFRTIPPGVAGDSYEYYREQDRDCLAEREAQAGFHAEVVEALRKRLAFDCAITPAVHYRTDFPWARAFEESGLPFVALHKELTVIDERHIPERIDIYREAAFRFQGSWVFVTSENAKILMSEGGVFDPARIEVTGLPRMDRLFRDHPAFAEKSHAGRQVTFFSFPHYCGGMGIQKERRSKLFSQNDDEGFVTLFKAVHSAIAELALRHPEVRFRIKPKIGADWWISEIEHVFKVAIGRTTADLPNCEIVDDPAPALIRGADVVVGFNSTVLLESLAMGRPTIMPYFAEAETSLTQYVYLRDHLEAFSPARSAEALIAEVEGALSGAVDAGKISAGRRNDCLTYYLGYDDGRNVERIAEGLRRVVRLYRDGGTAAASQQSRAA